MANHYGYHDNFIFILAILTTVGFQITSNFANDYGDGVKGTDNKDRIGPKRAYQSGSLSPEQLRAGIGYSVLINLLLVLILLYTSFGKNNLGYFLIFAFLAIASMWAAIRYTVGVSAYGYKGLGDVFVFSFFGFLSVLGSMFLYTKFLTIEAIFPAVTIGLLSVGVLNLNNLRDYATDKKANKKTMVVKMGISKGKKYHYFLLTAALVSLLFYIYFQFNTWINTLCLLAFIPIFLHFRRVYKIQTALSFDPELKKLALSTFFLAILFYIGYNNFL